MATHGPQRQQIGLHARASGGVGRGECKNDGRRGHGSDVPSMGGRRLAARVIMQRLIVSHPNPMTEKQEFRTWMCLICGFIYDEAEGLTEEGIPPGTRWEDLPNNWSCPECGARNEDIEILQT